MRRNDTPTMWRTQLVALVVVVGALLGAQAASMPGHLQALAAGSDTVTLAIDNGTTFPYALYPAPRFTITVVLGSKPTENLFLTAGVKMDSGESFGGAPGGVSSDGLTYTFDVLANSGPITAGARSAVGVFTNPFTNITTTSAPVNFTVTPSNPQMGCAITNQSSLIDPGQALIIAFSYNNPPAPVDWQDGTYSIAFSGPQNTTFPNLKGDSNDDVAVTAPTQVGMYKVTCAFSGTNNFQASSGILGYITVSGKHALGSVQFYTNPTTPETGKPVSVYVVLHPAPGLPTPTGYVSFTLTGVVGDSTNIIQLNSDGTLLVNLGAIPVELNSGSSWYVNYDGDAYYDTARVNFPLTNPPIPGNSGGGGSSGGGSFGNPQATPSGTPHATATATATTTRVATAAPTPAPASSHAVIGSSGGATPILLASGALGALVVLGGVVGLLVWSRRRRLALANAATVNTVNSVAYTTDAGDGYGGPPFMSAPPPGMAPPYNDDRTIADDGAFPYRQE